MKSNKDRYLVKRGQVWWYIRTIPTRHRKIDNRGSQQVKLSLKTDSLSEAREFRDLQERRDDALWAALDGGASLDDANVRYKAIVKAEKALNLEPVKGKDLVADLQERKASGESFFNSPVYKRMAAIEATLGDNRMQKVGEIRARIHDSGIKELVAKAEAATNEGRVEDADRLWGTVLKQGPLLTAEEEALLKDYDDNPSNVLESDAALPMVGAALGINPKPPIFVSGLVEFYEKELVPEELINKSGEQKDTWRNWPRVATRHFIEVIGDREVMKITREEALRMKTFWRERLAAINPKTGKQRTAGSMQREVGSLRKMYTKLAEHLQDDDRRNPFENIKFKGPKGVRDAFPVEWVQTKFLQGNRLAGVGLEARAIWVALIETGARLGEIANLEPDQIHLDSNIPHIIIEQKIGRCEIKNRASHREVPLVGVSLAAIRLFPNGFKTHRDECNKLSLSLSTFMRRNGLRQNANQTAAHSIRHTFKDRCREAAIQPDLIEAIIGHTERGPIYGRGFSLERKLEALEKIVLPFDPAVLG